MFLKSLLFWICFAIIIGLAGTFGVLLFKSHLAGNIIAGIFGIAGIAFLIKHRFFIPKSKNSKTDIISPKQ